VCGNSSRHLDFPAFATHLTALKCQSIRDVYDFNLTGFTDALDESIILENMSLDCNPSGA